MDNKIIEVSSTSLSQAKLYAKDANFGRSFAHYLVYIELRPNDRQMVENEFVDVLIQWIDILKSNNQHEDMLNCLQNAIEYYPNNYIILTITAQYLTSWNQHETALDLVTKALTIKETYLPATKLINFIKNTLMERWHIRMLNDIKRNESFRKAIEKKIAEGYKNILDIGAGTGLFSIFATKSKYSVNRVSACECSSIMAGLARKVLKTNDCDAVNFIEKHSTDMKISDEFPEKANLVVAEVFDSGVFGENVLPTFIYAWEYLLEPYPSGKIIPASVELNISALECTELAKKHRVYINDIKGLSFERLNVVNLENEPYDTEDFFCFKDYKCITNPFQPWIIDFTNVNQLKKLLNGESFNLKLTYSASGTVDAFLVWFKLNLDDDISIDNRPCEINRNCCWEQAIFYLDSPIKITPGHNISVSLLYKNGTFRISPKTPNSDHLEMCKVSKSVVRFLNDVQCLDALYKVAQYLSKQFSKRNINILDLAPFPYLGLLLAKACDKNASLKCCLKKTDREEELVKIICGINDINCQVQFIESPDECRNEKFDVIYLNVLEMEGELSQNNILYIPLLKRMLKPNGIFLPSFVTLYGMIVESDWLKRVSQVDDVNVGNFRVAEFVKKYETDEQLDFTLKHLDCKELTERCQLARIELGNSITEEVYRKVNMTVEETGEAHGICYWFEINLMGYKHTTGPENNYPFINNAAFLLNPSIKLNRNDQIPIEIIQQSGLLKISCGNVS